MKCAIPGRYDKPLRPNYYGSSNSLFSDLWKDIYLKNLKEEIEKSYPEVVQDFDAQKEWEAHNEAIKDYAIYLGRGSGKTKLQNETFEEYMRAIKEKDAQEHSQK